MNAPPIFQPLTDLLAKIRGETEPEGGPYGLSEGEIAALKKLHGTDVWHVLLDVVDERTKLESEKLLDRNVPEREVTFSRGAIWGMRHIPSVIENAIQQEAYEDERRRSERERERRESGRARDIATYGHPARGS